VPFAFVKNVVQIAFLTHGCCFATSVSICGYLSVGQFNLPANRAFQNQKSGWSIFLSNLEIFCARYFF
jgi:hypothetical protein